MKKMFVMLASFFLIQACSFTNETVRSYVNNEIVMTEGMQIIVTNNSEKIRITAGPGFKRCYSWDGATRSVKMIPRNKRWYGKLGLYYPGKGNHWTAHDGITRAVLQEAQLNFNSEKDALAFLRHKSRIGSTVYNNEGLVVTWSRSMNPSGGNGGVLFVDVWQIYIAGKVPIQLPGSQNEKIHVVIVKENDQLCR